MSFRSSGKAGSGTADSRGPGKPSQTVNVSSSTAPEPEVGPNTPRLHHLDRAPPVLPRACLCTFVLPQGGILCTLGRKDGTFKGGQESGRVDPWTSNGSPSSPIQPSRPTRKPPTGPFSG